jgi:hypothetical protein
MESGDEEQGMGPDKPLSIMVQQSIEMKSDIALVDDTESERGLVLQDVVHSRKGSGNIVLVSGPRRTGSNGLRDWGLRCSGKV